MKTIFLIGFMGSGKTTVGKILSEQLGLPLIDLDEEIVKRFGPISEIFSSKGEEAFRELERTILEENRTKQAVLSCGGGIVEKKENRERLSEQANVFFLKVDFSTSSKRVKEDEENVRPNAQNVEKFQKLFEKRQELYKESATFTIDTVEKTPIQLAKEIIDIVRKEEGR